MAHLSAIISSSFSWLRCAMCNVHAYLFTVILVNRTTIFEWRVVSCGTMNTHQIDMCLEEIRPRCQNLLTNIVMCEALVSNSC